MVFRADCMSHCSSVTLCTQWALPNMQRYLPVGQKFFPAALRPGIQDEALPHSESIWMSEEAWENGIFGTKTSCRRLHVFGSVHAWQSSGKTIHYPSAWRPGDPEPPFPSQDLGSHQSSWAGGNTWEMWSQAAAGMTWIMCRKQSSLQYFFPKMFF